MTTSIANVNVSEAQEDDKFVLRQLHEFYEYDFSEYLGTDVNAHGTYDCKYLDLYWREPNLHPYLIRVAEKLAGFVLVNDRGDFGPDRRCLNHFFIITKYRKRGVGLAAAIRIFDKTPGKWEVKQHPDHTGSTIFWRKVVDRYTGGNFKECECEIHGRMYLTQTFETSTSV
jgi:predicted acetyltransferase